MTEQQIAAMRQALEALETAFNQTCSVGRPKDWKQLSEAITTLYTAIEQAKELRNMNELEKAAQQALEALIASTGELRIRLIPGDEQIRSNEKAITALRQALEQQPVKEFFDEVTYSNATTQEHRFEASEPARFERPLLRQQPADEPSVAVRWLAEMVMSDCGCSTNNERLLERISNRIEQHIRANTRPQPAAPEQKGN